MPTHELDCAGLDAHKEGVVACVRKAEITEQDGEAFMRRLA
jgi:hypothetical protein